MAEQTPPPAGGDPGGPDDIDALLAAVEADAKKRGLPSGDAPAAAAAGANPADPATSTPAPDDIDAAFAAATASKGKTAQQSIDDLLKSASFEDPSPGAAGAAAAPVVAVPEADAFKLPNFNQVMQEAQASSVDLLRDVELNVKIELGRSRMLVEDVLKLAEGSVVELDKLAGDPVDVFVNDRLVARGEVLVLNDNFCVRVNEIVAGAKEEGL